MKKTNVGRSNNCLFINTIEKESGAATKMKQSRRQSSLPREEYSPETENQIGTSRAVSGYACGVARRPILAAAALFTLLLLLMVLSSIRRSSPFDVLLLSGYPSPEKTSNATCSTVPKEPKFHGGFLSPALNESSCLSRYQSSLYRKPSNHTPSDYLVEKLRRYEALHKKCGPRTELFRQSIKDLASDDRTTGPRECNYVVWLPADGLGNRMISIASAFLYALLNDKVLLLHLPNDMADLFCEPFPDSSWLLPRDDFPVKNLDRIFEHDPRSYGNLLRNKVLSYEMDVSSSSSSSLPGYIYLHLLHGNDDFDKMFYCGESQQQLKNFPWLLLRSNEYFAPAFFFMPEFQEELDLLFPEKSTVFHHLGRYLFNPTNSVWGYITRYHEAYLANARDVLGIQIRIFAFAKVEFDDMLSQIVSCSVKENLLPEVDLEGPNSLPGITGAKPKAVLVASLMGDYSDKLRDRYYEHAAVTGEVVGVYQPSHEEQQRTHKLTHNMKAFAEMYLLSMSDEVITSPFSTFGYVAHGLGGLRPWILVRNRNNEPPCVRSLSMEPCFHFPPPLDCKSKKKVDKASVMPYVKHCEDFSLGIKVFDN